MRATVQPSDKLILKQVNALLKLYGQPPTTKQKLLCAGEETTKAGDGAGANAARNPTELRCPGEESDYNAMLNPEKHYEQ